MSLVGPYGADGNERSTGRAIVIAEVLFAAVLSESTTHIDFEAKREEYLGLGTLDTYLILSQDKTQAWQWTRDADGAWPSDPILVESGPIEIARIGVAFDRAELYLGVL